MRTWQCARSKPFVPLAKPPFSTAAKRSTSFTEITLEEQSRLIWFTTLLPSPGYTSQHNSNVTTPVTWFFSFCTCTYYTSLNDILNISIIRLNCTTHSKAKLCRHHSLHYNITWCVYWPLQLKAKHVHGQHGPGTLRGLRASPSGGWGHARPQGHTLLSRSTSSPAHVWFEGGSVRAGLLGQHVLQLTRALLTHYTSPST